ncbi:MAG: hypothetical protein OEW05_11980 [Candidatus Aminicenantes bacterium]|nr:hypothetical protein [Candidatus Aminicenantes bacterium]
MDERTKALLAFGLLFAFALGYALFVNLPVMQNHFLFADQATYFSMTQSIAHDGDLEWSRKDLIRYKDVILAGPIGIFLKKGQDGRIFFAKSFAYSLFAAPFVRLFGINGHYVFHAVLLALVFYLGFLYLSLDHRPTPALLGVLTFLFASVAAVYFFWISPDFFNFCLVFIVLFLALYKTRRADLHPAAGPERGARSGTFLLTDASSYVAAFLAGIAIFSKPPNVGLLIPLVLVPFLAKRYKQTALILVFCLLSAVLLFGANYLLTSDWNFMGGERKTFGLGNPPEWPLEKLDVTFDSTGAVMSSAGYFERMLLPPKFILYNLFYYFFGRFNGLTWYFFPAVLALLLFLGGPKRPWRWLVFAALAVEILIYIVLMPTNIGGGGGSLANRYFVHIFPLCFFLPAVRLKARHLALVWGMAALFIAPLLVDPIKSSSSPAAHVKRFPIKALPLDMTQVNEWATNTSPIHFRIPVGAEPNDGMLHILDDNFHQKHPQDDGLWTFGNRTCEMVLKTYFPVRKVTVRLMNNPRYNNRITVTLDGRTQSVVLGPRQKASLEFPVGTGFKIRSSYLHRLKIRAAKGAAPYYEDESSKERRELGVYFAFDLEPRE